MRNNVQLKSHRFTGIIYAVIFFSLLLIAHTSYSSESIYTIQIGSFSDIESAQKIFNSIVDDQEHKEHDYLRIEKIGTFYTVRIGKFENSAAAEKIIELIKPQYPSAVIMTAYFIEERIIRFYKAPPAAEKTKDIEEKPVQNSTAEDVKSVINVDRIIKEQELIGERTDIEKKDRAEEKKPVEELKPLYSAGPWTGKVIDSKTKLPVEGALVAVVWYRMYDTRFTVLTDLHESEEVFTDKNGYFEIPAYVETGEHKDSWPKPQLPEAGPIEIVATGPVIKDPEFIIYKPGLHYYPKRTDLVLFATGPFTVEFQEVYTEIRNNQEQTILRKNTRDFPEGIVYSGEKCYVLLEKLIKKTSFEFNYLFYKINKAEEEIKKSNIPLDCPKDAEPIPIFILGYRYDLENPFKKGGYIIIELSKTTSDEERLKALPEYQQNVSPEKLPLLYRLIKEEKEYLKNRKIKK